MKLSIVLLACICSLSGCTLTGAVIGSVNDNSTPDFDTLKTNELNGFDPEDDVLVVKKDGRIVKGEFTGIEKAPADSYVRAYNSYLLQDAGVTRLPRLGDSVFAVVSGRQLGPFTFKGLDYDGVWLERSDSSSFRFKGSIVCNNPAFSLETGIGDIPLMSCIIITSESIRTQIPIESVKHIIVPHRKHGFITGLLVGGAINCSIVAIIASQGPVFKDLHLPGDGK